MYIWTYISAILLGQVNAALILNYTGCTHQCGNAGQGIQTRASLDQSGMAGHFNSMPAMNGMKMMPPQLRAGRVIIGVAEPGHADIFRNAFTQVSQQIEVVPAMGPDNVWTTCQQVPSLLADTVGIPGN